jgi:hypothetical protein
MNKYTKAVLTVIAPVTLTLSYLIHPTPSFAQEYFDNTPRAFISAFALKNQFESNDRTLNAIALGYVAGTLDAIDRINIYNDEPKGCVWLPPRFSIKDAAEKVAVSLKSNHPRDVAFYKRIDASEYIQSVFFTGETYIFSDMPESRKCMTLHEKQDGK